MRKILKLHCFLLLHVIGGTALFYSGRQTSREGGECKPRLKPRVFKRFCKDITSCENDKDCLGAKEQCICDEDCGKRCLDPSASCTAGSCRNGGVCHGSKCICKSGFIGVNCANDTNECEQLDICKNGGSCSNTFGSYTCSCIAGFTGKNCSVNIDDCITTNGTNPCQNGGACIDRVGKYMCNCTHNYTGLRCEYENECMTKKPCGTGKCRHAFNGTARCHCGSGVTGSYCEHDINECNETVSPCEEGRSTCHNTIGSYKCICNSGYTGENCHITVDNCQSSPCQHGGLCSSYAGSYKCHCAGTGFTGRKCERDVNECSSDPCQNGGQCVNRHANYTCKCRHGYSGKNCEIDPCGHNPCVNGNCSLFAGKFKCHCNPGFNGTTCETNIDDCAQALCQNNATCIDGTHNYTCDCLRGFSGSFCDQDMDECKSSPCQNGAKCNNTFGSYTCLCPVGFTGQNCETNVNDCAYVTCQNGGKCIDNLNNYTCVCHPGFAGRNCEENIDECALSPCTNGGICEDGVASYSCLCPPKRTGRNCEIAVDNCLTNDCKHGAKCKNTGTSYTCECLPGFSGKYCEVDIDECSSSPCKNGSSCQDGVNDYKCSCKPGFTGRNCEIDIDYCQHGVCFNNGVCQDGVTSFSCKCANGFSGKYCEYLVHQCESAPCKNGATCVNQIGNYSCYCTFGTEGRNCERSIDWCSRRNPCKNGATCFEEESTYNCKCAPGFNGELCDLEVLKDCATAAKKNNGSGICQNGGTCRDRGSYYSCSCSDGFAGSFCERNIDDCKTGPCKNGATCEDGIQNYTCNCFPGFTGTNCEININECKSSPCVHGICFNLINEYYCKCPKGYVGTNCDINPNDCSNETCLNGGNCSDGIDAFKCRCKQGYTGERCEEDFNECSSNPCSAKGTERCVDLVNNYRCDCKLGFTKSDCSFDINECLSSPCRNNGTCRNEIGKYVCVCPYGYSGRNCEKSIKTCSDKPCQNDGVCREFGSKYSCDCKPGVTGYHCEMNVDDCMSSPCKNNGRCVDGYGNFSCECRTGFSGHRCEFKTCDDKSCKNGRILADCRCICRDGYSGASCELKTTSKPTTRSTTRSITRSTTRSSKCPYTNCSTTFDVNANCDQGHCNTKDCNFQGTSCSLNREPWKKCSNKTCWEVFSNKKCDSACNNAECMYDAYDCLNPVPPCSNRTNCIEMRGNEICDSSCDTMGCGYDGPDCKSPAPKLLPRLLIMWLRLDIKTFRKTKNTFLVELSVLLRTVVIIDVRDGVEEIESVLIKRRRRSIRANRFKRDSEDGKGTKVNLKVDNRKCVKDCFDSTDQVANYLAALKTRNVKIPGDPFKIETEDDPDTSGGESAFSPLWIAILCVTVPLIAVGVLVGGKRVFAKLWLPEGFPARPVKRRSQRRDPVGEDATDKASNCSIGKSSTSNDCVDDYAEQGHSGARPPKRFKLIEGDGPLRIATPKDNRQWSAVHREVADVNNRTISSLSVLTPPQEGQECSAGQSSDVNAVGPGGLTPLMLAVSRGSYLDGTIEDDKDSDDSGGQVVGELIQFGARTECRSDHAKETALHLAARHARADAAKRLLDAGADVNARERTGRTPLHLAVTADAQGVFQILLRHRATELDAQSDDGTTPLIYAARFMVVDLMDELIKAGAKVNLTDKQGKTALHWAASVNNDKATELLLKNNAKKDAQDSKGQTPLFLASKEGSASVVKILLSSFANRKLADNMDQSPLDIAKQREHADIVKLLSDWSIGCKSPTAAPAPTSPGGEMSPLTARTLSPPDVRPKTNRSPGSQAQAENPHQKQNRKKRRKSRTESESQPVVAIPMFPSNSPPCVPAGNGTSPRQGLSPFSNNSYGSSLSPSNSTFSPPLPQIDGMPSPLRDSDPIHGGLPDADFYSMAEEIAIGYNYGGQMLPGTETEFMNIENPVDLNELTLFFGSNQQEGNKDCMYANQYPPVNMILPNGVNNEVRMHYGGDRRTQGAPAKSCVRSPSQITAWNALCHNGPIKQSLPTANMDSIYHRGPRNRDCQYPTPPYELSPTSPEHQWSSSSSRSSNSDCSTC